jgi:hypothetical protein
MRTIHIWVPIYCVSLVIAGAAQELTPTALEAFAARPGAKVIWSKEVGQLEGSAARATLSAIAIEDPSSTPRLMRGVRIDLTHRVANPDCNLRYWDWAIVCARPNAALFLDESDLSRAHQTMAEKGIARVYAGYSGGITHFRVGGSLEPSGLIVVGYTLDGRRPQELTALLEQAIAALEGAPR